MRTRPSTTSRTNPSSRVAEPSGAAGRIRLWIPMADDLHELSALYALDVLSDDERARFERHLEECDQCRAEIDGLRTAASSLAFAVEGPPPPPELRARVLAAAHAEGQNVVPLRPRRPSFAVSLAAAV